jgi:hypothetical protein
MRGLTEDILARWRHTISMARRLKENRKAREYVVSDKLIDGAEGCDPRFKPGPGNVDWLAEYDLGRSRLEVSLKLAAIFEGLEQCPPRARKEKNPKTKQAIENKGSDHEIESHESPLLTQAEKLGT